MTRISSYLLGPGSAICYNHSTRIGACHLRSSTPSIPANGFNQSRALHFSRRRVRHLQWLRHLHSNSPRGTLFGFLLASAGICYSTYKTKPLALESDETFKSIGQGMVKQKYISPTIPLTIEQANETLRRIEGSQAMAAGSGILRLDTMQLPSNPITEDMCLSATGYENGEIRWMLSGIYDGHAYESHS